MAFELQRTSGTMNARGVAPGAARLGVGAAPADGWAHVEHGGGFTWGAPARPLAGKGRDGDEDEEEDEDDFGDEDDDADDEDDLDDEDDEDEFDDDDDGGAEDEEGDDDLDEDFDDEDEDDEGL